MKILLWSHFPSSQFKLHPLLLPNFFSNRETAGSMKLWTVGFAGAHRTHSSSPCLSTPNFKKKWQERSPFRDGQEIERNINKFEDHLDGLDEYVDMVYQSYIAGFLKKWIRHLPALAGKPDEHKKVDYRFISISTVMLQKDTYSKPLYCRIR